MNNLKDLKNFLSDDEFIKDICISYRQDFRLLSVEEQASLMVQCKKWLDAIENNLENYLND